MNGISLFHKTYFINQQEILLWQCEVCRIMTSSTSWPGKQRISILEKDESDKAGDLNKNVSGRKE